MRISKAFFGAALCVGISAFAVASLASAGGFFVPEGSPTALRANDDPVRNGLRIIETRGSMARGEIRANDSNFVLLDEFVNTAKSKPSPYQ